MTTTNPPFQPVGSRLPFRDLESGVRDFWKDGEIFRRSVDERPADKIFSFFEGPPTANGSPGVHHILTRVFKDIFPRYKTMRGYRVHRKGGWDTHGLPVELEVERELGLSSKQEIEAYGIAEFNARCRESVMRYVKQWEDMTERIGFWIDMDDAYRTYDRDYVESCWWILKTLWDADLVYEARRTTPHCPRCETSLSSHELSLGYQDDIADPSISILFQVQRDSLPQSLANFKGDTYLVAWTTTPWTLPGNSALAVAANETYAVVRRGDDRLILARARLEATLAADGDDDASPPLDLSVPGSDLVGLTYEGLYEPREWGVPVFIFDGPRLVEWEDASERPARRVVSADFVSMEDGTGIVHIAPAFGIDDYTLGRDAGLFFIQPVDLKGRITGQDSPWQGEFVKDADAKIIAELDSRGMLLKQETIRHTYPFCWRCGTPLLYYAKPSWYIATTKVAASLQHSNDEQMSWYPQHIQHGRYGDWIANNIDWAVSRERYWGTPLPFWRCQDCDAVEAVGSYDELAGRATNLPNGLDDPHRPFVDEVEISCGDCGATMRRIPEVADAWFDSGAMPYAQWHYPFENEELFAERFPADFICEAVDQTRGWFYSLHAEATLLHAADEIPEPVSYRHVISLGHILDESGEKMSKSKGNVVDPWSVLDEHGADATRWYMISASPPGNPRRFSSNLVGEAQRKFLLTLWNTYSFFVTYANIDEFDPASQPPAQRTELDRWVRSALHHLIEEVTQQLDDYEPTAAARAIEGFVDQLSNWYVRRSRRRFWKSDDADDQAAAYHTLHECLTTLTKLLAPFTPYLAEEMHRNLAVDDAESVHLAAWPEADTSLIDADLNQAMELVQRLASLGRAARSKAGIKVRQPLPEVLVGVADQGEAALVDAHAEILLEELNVKALRFVDASTDLVGYVIKPNLPVLGPRLGKDVGQLRGALQSLEPEMAAQIASAAQAGEAIEVAGVSLTADDLLIETTEGAGAATAQEAGYTAAVTTETTPELEREGWAREIVHLVQGMRRTAGFEVSDRIELWLTTEEADLRTAVQEWAGHIQDETLALSLHDIPPEADSHHAAEKIDGMTIAVGVRKIAT